MPVSGFEDSSVRGSDSGSLIYSGHEFIEIPCAPAEEDAIAGYTSYEWPFLYYQGVATKGKKRASRGTSAKMVGVFVKVELKAETLLPAGGQFVSHWEYLASRRDNPGSVSTWLRIVNPDPNGPRGGFCAMVYSWPGQPSCSRTS